jgi:hypothetical protein
MRHDSSYLLIAAIEPLVPPEKHDEEKPSPKGLDQ